MTEEKLTGLDFFDALRMVARTTRRVRYMGSNIRLHTLKDWSEYVTGTQGEGALLTKDRHWWPSFCQQKEKAWEVEPEKRKIKKN